MYSSFFFSSLVHSLARSRTHIYFRNMKVVAWKQNRIPTTTMAHQNKMDCTICRCYYRFIHSLVLDGIRLLTKYLCRNFDALWRRFFVFSLYFYRHERSQTDWYVFRMVHACHPHFVVSIHTAVLSFFCLHFFARAVCLLSYYMGDMLPIKLPVIYNNRLSLFSILLRPFGVVVGGGGSDDVTVVLHLNAVHRFLYKCAHHHHHYTVTANFRKRKNTLFTHINTYGEWHT